jgi:translation initiation factor IF-3
MAHQELGMQLLDRVRDDLETMAKVEAEPKLEGRQMIMILAPTPSRARPQPQQAAAAS